MCKLLLNQKNISDKNYLKLRLLNPFIRYGHRILIDFSNLESELGEHLLEIGSDFRTQAELKKLITSIINGLGMKKISKILGEVNDCPEKNIILQKKVVVHFLGHGSRKIALKLSFFDNQNNVYSLCLKTKKKMQRRTKIELQEEYWFQKKYIEKNVRCPRLGPIYLLKKRVIYFEEYIAGSTARALMHQSLLSDELKKRIISFTVRNFMKMKVYTNDINPNNIIFMPDKGQSTPQSEIVMIDPLLEKTTNFSHVLADLHTHYSSPDSWSLNMFFYQAIFEELLLDHSQADVELLLEQFFIDYKPARKDYLPREAAKYMTIFFSKAKPQLEKK